LGLVIGTNVQAYDATLQSISALGTGVDKLAYITGVDTWAEATLSAAGRALIDDADAAAQRTTLGLIAGGSGDIWFEKAGDTITGDLHLDGTFTNYNSSLQDMGYETRSDKRGYGTDYITDKKLSNVLIGGNSRIENGGIRIDVENDPDTFEIYLRDIWNTIIYDMTTDDGDFRHTPIAEEIYVWRGDSVMVGLNGQPVIQEYGASMGAYPTYPIINGGTF